MIVRNDILIGAVFQAKTARYDPKLNKAQFFIKGKSGSIGADNGIELQNTKIQIFCHGKTVADQLFSYMLSPGVPPYRVACIADMSAAPDIIGVQDIKT